MRKDYFKDELEDTVEVSKEETKVPEKKVQKVKVTTNLLNIRKGPGKNYQTTLKFLKLGEEVEITEVVDGFGHLKKSGDWICMDFVKMI